MINRFFIGGSSLFGSRVLASESSLTRVSEFFKSSIVRGFSVTIFLLLLTLVVKFTCFFKIAVGGADSSSSTMLLLEEVRS